MRQIVHTGAESGYCSHVFQDETMTDHGKWDRLAQCQHARLAWSRSRVRIPGGPDREWAPEIPSLTAMHIKKKTQILAVIGL